MSAPNQNRTQLSIDFEYDERVSKLALEFAIMIAPIVPPGITKDDILRITSKMAWEAAKKLDKFQEPSEKMICHTCDASIGPKERARVVVCVKCGLKGGSPGSEG